MSVLTMNKFQNGSKGSMTMEKNKAVNNVGSNVRSMTELSKWSDKKSRGPNMSDVS